MKVINIESQLEKRRTEVWWHKVNNITRVLNLFSIESRRIIEMIKAHGDKDELEDGCVYPGIHEYFCEEPTWIEAEGDTLHTNTEDLEVGRYALVLDVVEEEIGGETFRYGKLTYVRKKIGEPL